MPDINAWLSVQKRLLDALPRLQDESIESGDYSKVKTAEDMLNRLQAIGSKIQDENGLPAAQTPSLLAPQDDLQSTEFLPEGGPTPPAPALLAKPQAPAPALLAPQTPAPVTINVAPQTPVPSLLAPQDQGFKMQDFTRPETQVPTTALQDYKAEPVPALLRPGPKDQAKTAMGTIKKAEAAVYDFINKRSEGYENINPHEADNDQLVKWMQEGNWNQIASYIRAKSKPTENPRGPVAKFFLGSPDKPEYYPGEAGTTELIPTVEEAAKANDFLNEQRKPGGVLGLTREEVMPRQPKLLAEKRALDEQIKKSGSLELPSLLTRKAEVDKNLENVAAFEKANPMAPIIEPTPPGLLEGEPGEAEAKAGLVPPTEPVAPPEAPVDYELQRENIPAPGLEVPNLDKPKNAVKEAEKIIKEHAPDILDEFHKRVMTELGAAPKPNFLMVIGTILGGLAGNTTAMKIWADKVNSYNDAKRRIGSEVFSAAKQAKSLESQEKRAAGREEAAHQRAMERDKAAADRLEKQLGFGREKLTESARVNNIKLNLQKRQQDINRVYRDAQTATAQQKTALMPLHDELNALTRKQNDLARMAASFAMPQSEWATQTAAIDAQIQDVLSRMAQIMGTRSEGE